MVDERKIRTDIEMMSAQEVDRILSEKFNVYSIEKLRGYSEGNKRDLLYDLERDFQYVIETRPKA